MATIGRPPSCVCGTCEKCKRRLNLRRWYQAKTLDERRAWIARRDPERSKANDRARYLRDKEKRRAAMAAYLQTPRGRAASNAAKVRFTERNRNKKRASELVNLAIKRGDLVREQCEVCGSPKTQGHHDDYSKPLEVRWLCTACHAAFHVAMRGLPTD